MDFIHILNLIILLLIIHATPTASGSNPMSSSAHVAPRGATSGLDISFISEHLNRARLTSSPGSKLIGALLGTQANREVSIVNSFELTYSCRDGNGDVDMTTDSVRDGHVKQVFPTLEVIGWYAIGEEPTLDDVFVQQQLLELVDTPIFLLFHPSSTSNQDLPVTIYESALAEGSNDDESAGKFVELEYGIETGEAERIAVDGVSRGDMGGGDEDSVVGNLSTQRNAIRMLYDRILILVAYVEAVINKSAEPDNSILRQIAALVTTLPTMDAEAFQRELFTDHGDVQLMGLLSTLTKQLSALGDVSLQWLGLFAHRLVHGQAQRALPLCIR
ncbi:hypothetical protein JCM24511_09186 [Saitozyma sp. JCM 24511]|nr:hypothetical protein JCM24511_09186 [Saitozyma sp. JCM 24511]